MYNYPGNAILQTFHEMGVKDRKNQQITDIEETSTLEVPEFYTHYVNIFQE